MKESLKKAVSAYNQIAEIYFKYTSQNVVQYQCNKFISYLKGKDVLDAGCGCGRDVDYFFNEGLKVIGVDASDELIKAAKKQFKGSFKVGDFIDSGFKDGSFDGVWNMCGLVHTPRDELPNALKEFHRILRKNGVLYVAVNFGKGEKVIKKEKYMNQPRTYVLFSKKEVEKAIQDSGFSIIDISVNKVKNKEYVEVFARKV